MTTEQLGAVVANARAKLEAEQGDYLDEAVALLADRNAELARTVTALQAVVATLREQLGTRCPHGRVGALCDDCGTP